MRSLVWALIMLTAGAVSASCSGAARLYEGEQLPKDKVATLIVVPSFDLSSEPVKVRDIDGVAVDPMVDRAEVLPGKHIVSGEIGYRSSWPARFSTSFEAEAGHTYEVIGGCRSENDCAGTVRDVKPTS